MTDDLVKRLHWHRDFIGTNLWPDGYPFLREVRDRLGDAADRIEALAADRENRLADLRIIKAERDRLREALQKLSCKCSSNCDWEHEDVCPSWIARAALKGESHD